MKGFIFLPLVLVFSFTLPAQNKITNKASIKIDNIVEKEPGSFLKSTGVSNQNADYQLVDFMANAFGPAISSLNPLAYDPYSDVVAIVHRAHSDYGSGSGELWYNISTDRGATWSRVNPAINSSFTQEFARYPSMAISNSQQSPGINNALTVFSWPEFDPVNGSFGWLGYAADQPAGAGNYTGNILMDNYSSSEPIWASDNSSWVFWIAAHLNDTGMTLFRTQDFITIEQLEFPSSIFQGGGIIPLGGVSVNGVCYVGAIGTYPPPDPGNPIISGWYPGYVKSTDYGLTWSDWQVIDFRQVPSISDYDRLYDFIKNDSYVSYCGDINVDNSGYVHFALALTDTTTDENTGINSIIDLYETNSGWDAKIIYTGLIDGSFDNGPGLGQMGPSPYFAFNAQRNVMACQWVNGLSESIPWCDLFFSYRTLSTNWVNPINLTMSDSINNSQSHLAPLLAVTGTEYTAFSMYAYQDGVSGPYTDTLQTTNIYIAPVTFNTENVPVELVNFSANVSGSCVTLNWETGTETNNRGFEIERNYAAGNSWSTIGFVKGNGTTSSSHKYQFEDNGLPSGEYSYRLKQIDFNGSYVYSEIKTVYAAGELSFELSQNFPNPFNPATEIQYRIPRTNLVVLKVYDVLGNEVQTIVNDVQEAGLHTILLNTNNLASGTYYYKLSSGDFVKVRKMLLLK